VLVMLAPVFIPASQLPAPLQVVSLGLPITYAAAALRSAVLGTLDGTFFLNIGVLLTITAFCMLVLQRAWKLD
jgi:ABC-type multidrug transport system permease subunit